MSTRNNVRLGSSKTSLFLAQNGTNVRSKFNQRGAVRNRESTPKSISVVVVASFIKRVWPRAAYPSLSTR
jgi:hypothetical protein